MLLLWCCKTHDHSHCHQGGRLNILPFNLTGFCSATGLSRCAFWLFLVLFSWVILCIFPILWGVYTLIFHVIHQWHLYHFLVLSLFLLFFLVGLFLVSFYSTFWKIFFACILGLVVCRGKRCLSTSTGTDRGPPCMLDNLVYLMETVHHFHSWCFLFLHYHSYI